MTYFLTCLSVLFNRKFADIEAANHRLASALYLKEEEKNRSDLSSEEQDAVDQPDGSETDASLQDPDKSSTRPAEAAASACSEELFRYGEHEPSVGKQSELENLRKCQPNSQTAAESKAEQEQKDEVVEIPPASSRAARRPSAQGFPHGSEQARNAHADSQVAQPDSGFIEFLQNVNTSPAVYPGLGPLAPEACDLSSQTFSGVSTCAQGQRNIADVTESQWSEIMDLVAADAEGYAEVEAYFESICACTGDAGQEAESAEFGFTDFSDSSTENLTKTAFEGGRLRGDTCEYVYEDGHGCRGPTQRQGGDSFNTAHVVVEQQLPVSLSYRSDDSELQTYQHPQGEGSCMLGNNPNFTLFEGVAQSFTVPLHYVKPRSIPTPPHEEDWPFTDILEDRTSVYG